MFLLDQKLFPGVGNYLKSEILYKSEIHPDAKWDQISKDKIYRILKNSKNLIEEVIKMVVLNLKILEIPKKIFF